MRVQLLEDQISLKRISSSFQYFGDMGQDVWSFENQDFSKISEFTNKLPKNTSSFQSYQTFVQKLHLLFQITKTLLRKYENNTICTAKRCNWY